MVRARLSAVLVGLVFLGCLSALDERDLKHQASGGMAGTAGSGGTAGAANAGAGGGGSSGRGGGAGTSNGGKGGSATGSAGAHDEAGGNAGSDEPAAGSASSGSGGSDAGEGGSSGAGADESGGTSGTTAGTSGSAGAGGSSGTAGAAGSGGIAGNGGGSSGSAGAGGFGQPTMTGSGSSTTQFATANVARNDVPYVFLANGWGSGWSSHSVRWEGTSFVVESLSGSVGPGGQPAGYPTTYCGRYLETTVPSCGLPAAIDSLGTLPVGWRWASNGSGGAYDAAIDIWLGNGTQLNSYLMLWLRDPPGYQPYGSLTQTAVFQGKNWNVWIGTTNGLPIVTYAPTEGQDISVIELDVLALLAQARSLGVTV